MRTTLGEQSLRIQLRNSSFYSFYNTGHIRSSVVVLNAEYVSYARARSLFKSSPKLFKQLRILSASASPAVSPRS